MITFQELILKLVAFWSEQGCAFQQGHDVEVGAGTFNPATFLRSLGPEPYNTVYIEPSRRPQDGRYGENPNRLQLFHQLQVIMKPSPFDIQKKYLESLKAIGLDLKKHDIRFVHDDWESPTLGAWGLGWEVWLDGMEITQFTYFQSIANIPLHPISAELTLGLERLCMVLQGVDNFFDMKWNDKLTYRELYHRNEVEWSHYNFEESTTAMWLKHFEDFEREAKMLNAKNLPIPAYDFVMKASHAFNMLEARGAFSTTERMGYIARIRDLARESAHSYLESRKTLEYPLLHHYKKTQEKSAKELPSEPFDASKTDDFLFEIGSEELPATFVPIGMQQLRIALEKLLKESKLSYASLEIYGTPRRLSALIKDLSYGTPDQRIEKRGPAIESAFDEAGKPTKQGLGFLKGVGLSSLTKEEIAQHPNLKIHDNHLYARIEKRGQSTADIFSKTLPNLILNLNFPKKMRWADLEISYPRPLQWLVALHGEHMIPAHLANLETDRITYGHNQLSPLALKIKNARDYLPILRKHFVEPDIAVRRKSIHDQLTNIEEETNTHALKRDRVLGEVLYLSEWPQLTHFEFSPDFLKAPDPVLVSEMVEHQRYFPLAAPSGKLTNRFVITADNTPSETIKEGNRNVLSARLSDGVFLYEQDLQTSLDAFADKLKNITYHKELGSIYDKVMRIKHILKTLAIGDLEKLKRAAHLCKADLASELVGEFPELQGTIGKYYALHQKEDSEVALAIEEHYMPRSEKGELPSSETGALLSLADKFDTLISHFEIGIKPTSSSDPYALRRQAIGILKILLDRKMDLDLSLFFKKLKIKEGIRDELLSFFTQRAKAVFKEQGAHKDAIEASLRGECTNPYDQFCRVKALDAFRQLEQFPKLFEVYKRAKGQLDKSVSAKISEKLLVEKEERALFDALKKTDKHLSPAIASKDYQSAYESLATLQSPLAELFDNVLILAEDRKVRENRLALISDVFARFDSLLDFSKLNLT